jgi:signal transduction histidine kinase
VGQGLLIVFPSAVLAVFSLYSLRQDRLLAEQQGTQLARQLAEGLAKTVLPRAFDLDLPWGSLSNDVARFVDGGWRRPTDDPLARHGDWLVGLIRSVQHPPDDGAGQNWPYALVHPPPMASLPAPSPLDPEDLPPPAAALWERALQTLHAGQYAKAAADIQQLLTNRLPEPLQAIARHRLALCQLRAGNATGARTNLNALIASYPEARGEAGMPLAPFAQLQLLELDRTDSTLRSGTNGLRGAPPPDLMALHAVGAAALLRPSVFSPQLLDRLGAVAGEAGQTWSRLWDVHERSRRFLGAFLAQTNCPAPEETRSLWLADEGGRSVLARWVPVGGTGGGALARDFWLVVWPGDRLEQALNGMLRSQVLPQYLRIGVDVAGTELAGVAGAYPALAVASGGGAGAVPELRVRAYLANREMLYASLRTRRIWFGGLIALSAGAVVVGYIAAWRAFQRQQQLAELKGNFVSAVSHELRAPIAAIRLMSEELEDIGAIEPAKGREYHHLINQECRRLSSLIENVLDFSRHDQGREEYVFEPTDMVALAVETVKVMAPCATRKGIALTTAIRGCPIPVAADGRAIQQAVVNLIDNAIKHSPDGATVNVELDFDSRPLPARAAAPVGQPAPCFKLSVEDHGEGIPPGEHGRIFERFYRRGSELRRETQGIGLGLAIVRFVAEAHGGRVTVRSAVGEGSRFTLELPVSDSHQAPISADA